MMRNNISDEILLIKLQLGTGVAAAFGNWYLGAGGALGGTVWRSYPCAAIFTLITILPLRLFLQSYPHALTNNELPDQLNK